MACQNCLYLYSRHQGFLPCRITGQLVIPTYANTNTLALCMDKSKPAIIFQRCFLFFFCRGGSTQRTEAVRVPKQKDQLPETQPAVGRGRACWGNRWQGSTKAHLAPSDPQLKPVAFSIAPFREINSALEKSPVCSPLANTSSSRWRSKREETHTKPRQPSTYSRGRKHCQGGNFCIS